MYSTPRRGLSSSFPKATFLMWISPYFGLSLPRLAQNHMLLKVHLNLNCWCFINFVPLVALHPTWQLKPSCVYNTTPHLLFSLTVYNQWSTGLRHPVLNNVLTIANPYKGNISQGYDGFAIGCHTKRCTWLWNSSKRKAPFVSEDHATLTTTWLISTKRKHIWLRYLHIWKN